MLALSNAASNTAKPAATDTALGHPFYAHPRTVAYALEQYLAVVVLLVPVH
jgi:hypothetical protein